MQFLNKSKHFVIITLVLLGVSLASFKAHKYYVSITKIEIDTQEKLLKSYTRVFIDDFEKLLEDRYTLKVKDFSKLKEEEKQQIASYINRKVSLAVNRVPVGIKFLGCSLENNFLYLFYEAPFNEIPKRLDVKNSILIDIFTNQINTVDVTFNNKVKSVHLTYQNNKKAIFF